MGITSSKDDPEALSLRDDQFPWDKMGSMNQEARPEKETAQLRALAEGAAERVMRELHALFPGESSTDLPKEGYTEREDDEVFARFSEFMKGGACKELYTAFEDCTEKSDNIFQCPKVFFPVLIKCVDAHSEYYQPAIIALGESVVEQSTKELQAFEELAATKQAERLNTISPLLRWRNLLWNSSQGRSKP